jgi:putative redox protein
MKVVDIEWRAGADRFGVRGGSGVAVSIDAPRLDPLSRSVGPGPAEMLLAAAGTCSAWDVVEILEKQRQAISAIDVHVEGEQDTDPPWPFRRIAIRFTVAGRDLDPEMVARAVRLSESRYCAVIATIRGIADVVVTCDTIEEGADLGPETAARPSGAPPAADEGT